jgi:site-specific recombinase XerD
MSVHDITQRDVALRLDEITAKSGKLAANQARSKLSAFFVWAMRRGLVEKNPVANTEQLRRCRAIACSPWTSSPRSGAPAVMTTMAASRGC